MKTIFFVLFILNIQSQGELEPEVLPIQEPVLVEVPTLDLKIPFLNDLFSNPDSKLQVGSHVDVYQSESQNYHIRVFKPSEKVLKLKIIHKETREKYLVQKYKWYEELQTLVAFECEQKEKPIPSKIEDVCKSAISTGTNILKIMVSGDIKDSQSANLPKVASCIKNKLVEYVEQETEECLIEVIAQGTDDVSNAIAMKVAQLEEQGYVCKGTQCTKVHDEVVTGTDTVRMETEKVRGHVEAE